MSYFATGLLDPPVKTILGENVDLFAQVGLTFPSLVDTNAPVPSFNARWHTSPISEILLSLVEIREK